MGQGWDHQVFLVDGHWIFRFPQQPEAASRLRREIAVVTVLAPIFERVSLKIPRYEKLGKPTAEYPYPFTGHRIIPGVAADTLPDGRLNQAALAHSLGSALGEMHLFPSARLYQLAIPTDLPGPDLSLKRAQAIEGHLLVALPLDLAAACGRWLAAEPQIPDSYPGPLRLIHRDICPDHLLIEKTTGNICGLIDFGDVAWGDPAVDFVVPLCWLGPEFVDHTLASYPAELDPGFGTRLRFLACAMSLCWLGEAQQGPAEPLDKHIAWIRRAFTVVG